MRSPSILSVRKRRNEPIKIQVKAPEGKVRINLRIVEVLSAQGHPNILARHPTTFEVTRDRGLTRRGDCVIGVSATRGPRDFSVGFRNLCMHVESRIMIELEAAGIVDTVEGRGSPKLSLKHLRESVGRKSSFVSDRTILIKADKAARDLDRELIHALTSSRTRLHVRVTVEF